MFLLSLFLIQRRSSFSEASQTSTCWILVFASELQVVLCTSLTFTGGSQGLISTRKLHSREGDSASCHSRLRGKLKFITDICILGHVSLRSRCSCLSLPMSCICHPGMTFLSVKPLQMHSSLRGEAWDGDVGAVYSVSVVKVTEGLFLGELLGGIILFPTNHHRPR